MNQALDFGFGGDEFKSDAKVIPYAQFLNGSSTIYGFAITQANAEMTGFEPTPDWEFIDYEFVNGDLDKLYITKSPRVLCINRSRPLMQSKDPGNSKIMPYEKEIFNADEYKAFSYMVIWPVDANNQLLSESPLRLKCSGYAGISFLKNFDYYNNNDSFCRNFLQTYKNLTSDRAINKNDVFYAHGVYQPNLVRQKVTSSYNGQSSFAVVADSFLVPDTSNFASLIVRNGSDVSDRIKQQIEDTKSWVDISEPEEPTADEVNSEGQELISLTPDPLGFNSSEKPQVKTKPVHNLSGDPNEESIADLIRRDAIAAFGWTKEGLDVFLASRYRRTSASLESLDEAQQTEIYDALQDPSLRDSFCPQEPPSLFNTEIPF